MERLTLEDVRKSGEIWYHIIAVYDALKGVLDCAIKQQSDFAPLRDTILQFAAEDANPPKGDLHFGAKLRSSSLDAFAEYVRDVMNAINGLAAEQNMANR